MDKRKAEVKRLIDRVRGFKADHGIEKIVVFGSFARGDFNKDSDVDLILVDKRFEGTGSFRRSRGFWLSWHRKHKMGYPVDFLCYSPGEFRKLSKKVSIVSEALKEGIAV